jgi:hypothetical protein
MRVPLKLKGHTIDGIPFEELTTTDNVSAEGFLCSCTRALATGAMLDVFMVRGTDFYAGRARVIRKELGNKSGQRYGFQFEEKTSEWVVNDNKC